MRWRLHSRRPCVEPNSASGLPRSAPPPDGHGVYCLGCAFRPFNAITTMGDLPFILISLGFFAVCIAYIFFCDKVR